MCDRSFPGALRHSLAASALGVALLGAGVVHAAEPIPGATLAGIRALVIERNPELKALAFEVEAMSARERPAGAFPDPMFAIEWRDIDNEDPSLNPSRVGATAYQFQQTFPLWGKRGLARDAARAATQAADAEQRARALELLAEAERAYARFWYAAEASVALDRVIAVLGDIEQLVTARYRTGLVPLQDPLKAQVEITLMQRERIALDAQRAEAASTLNRILDRSPDASHASPAAMPSLPIPWTLDEVIAQVELGHPSVLGAASVIEAARRNRELTYRNRYPDLTVRVSPIQMGDRIATWDLMLGIEIPLQQGRRRADEQEARSMEQAAEMRLAAVRAELRGRAAERYAAWRSAERQRVLVQDTLLGQAEASYRAALSSYQVGAVEFITLLEALREWRAAEFARFEATRDALERAADLRALIGSISP